MPGGNTSSRKKPYRMTKDAAQSYDNHALAGGRFYGQTMTGNTEDYIDTEVGIPLDGPANMTPGNVDGNAGFNGVDAGPGITADRKPKSGGDPTPGGGW